MQRFLPTGVTVGIATLLVATLVAATEQADSNLKLPPPLRTSSLEPVHPAIAGTPDVGVGAGLSPEAALPTLLDVVNHYDQQFGLGLTPSEKDELVQSLLSS